MPPMRFDYDLFVIGAGSGGVRAARMSAALGARVAVAEERHLGGTCVNVGCIPKKLFVIGSHYAEDFADSAAYGWAPPPAAFEWPTLRDNKTREIERLNEVYRGLLEGAGVTIMEARATFAGPHAVTVDGATVTAANVLVATGSWPSAPAFPGAEHCITSNEAFHLEAFPERVVIVGGGYVAVEFAGIFRGLGAETTLLYRGPLFLRGFDAGIRRFVAEEVRRKGVDVRFDAQVAGVERGGGALVVRTQAGEAIGADLALQAIGRAPNTAGLGLGRAGVRTDAAGAVPVDGGFRTNVPHVFAIGDVIAVPPHRTASRMVTNSSAAVGWMPMVASKSAFVAPALIATLKPCTISPASGPHMWAATTLSSSRFTRSFISVRSPRPESVCFMGLKADS